LTKLFIFCSISYILFRSKVLLVVLESYFFSIIIPDEIIQE